MTPESPQPRSPELDDTLSATAPVAGQVVPLAAYRAGGSGSRLVLHPSRAREAWRADRARMEADGRRFTRWGISRWSKVPAPLALVEPALAAIGLRRRAITNALAVQTTEVTLGFPDLPRAFDGYSILQLSDLHVGRVPGLAERTAALLRGLTVDLVALTGDMQSWGMPAAEIAAAEVDAIVSAVSARDGVLGVLGNHDSHRLVEPLERRGVRLLINERASVHRADAELHFVGVDDIHYFYTDAAERTLRARSAKTFSVALVHTPEFADIAAETGYALYLAGHTHGGQICLPGGRPVMTALDHRHRNFASGMWRCGSMTGYTSRGVGVARRARFNCPPEIVVLRLRRTP
jgi:hypothetical protein